MIAMPLHHYSIDDEIVPRRIDNRQQSVNTERIVEPKGQRRT